MILNHRENIKWQLHGTLEDNYLGSAEFGYYVGWRLFIAEDGRWTTLAAGD